MEVQIQIYNVFELKMLKDTYVIDLAFRVKSFDVMLKHLLLERAQFLSTQKRTAGRQT